jgi:hypothetical protein
MEEYLFENDLYKKNIFNFFTEFSKFLIKNKGSRNNFYDFIHSESRIIDFKYTINVKDYGNDKFNFYEKVEDKLFNYLNNSKTLISNVSSGILSDPLNKKNLICVVILKTCLAPTRENFDDFVCRLI